MRTPARIVSYERGFTLVEVMVALVLVGIVGISVTAALVRQQRFYSGATEVVAVHAQMRDAASILPMELRNISSSAGDISALSDSAIEFRFTYGSAIVCEVAGATVTLPPATLSNGNVLASFLGDPDLGDTVFVYDSTAPAATPWAAHAIISAPMAGTESCRSPNPFVAAADDGAPRLRFGVSPALGSGSPPGSPVRFTRRVRYRLYQASTDRQWYLGHDEYRAGGWSGVQPVSGPYRPYAPGAPTTSGLYLRYFTSGGDAVTGIAAARSIARVEVIVNGRSSRMVSDGGPARAVFHDSLHTAVAIRNRN